MSDNEWTNRKKTLRWSQEIDNRDYRREEKKEERTLRSAGSN